MCGIISMVYGDHNDELGKQATDLLKRLEYRGYDSTGAAFIDNDHRIRLLKKVGAPSRVCPELGIPACAGQRFIGQVRWATYGAVTDANSQPHQVGCKVELVGAHNGNISNTDALKLRLAKAGHRIASDNDGEMLVHLIEEHYAGLDEAAPELHRAGCTAWDGLGQAAGDRPEADTFRMIEAIRRAEAEAEGSYAAAITDPRKTAVFAIKSGSSLYAGIGSDDHGSFVVVSSDLTSVLSKTRLLLPLQEGQGIWFDHDRYFLFNLRGPLSLSLPAAKASSLDVQDIALDPRYEFYMEQEIHSAPKNLDRIIDDYLPTEEARQTSGKATDRKPVALRYQDWLARLDTAAARGGRVYLLASGTSYHAGLIASGFFGQLGRLAVYPCNPGSMRSAYLSSLGKEDLVIVISQSGETKDLVDMLQDIAREHPEVGCLALVNNENSRIPQELAADYLPLLCGTETAVAATKSFISQLAVLFLLAGGRRGADWLRTELRSFQTGMRACIEERAADLDRLAEGLFLKPSIHLLATGQLGLAKEGALKIREVVLNHAEGYDTAEFKHGPNTILGRNTLFSFPELELVIQELLTAASQAAAPTGGQPADAHGFLASRPELTERLFSDYPLVFLCPPDDYSRRITISQIHTHKIRGAAIILLAEADPDLRAAVEGQPAGRPDYRSCYIELPPSGNTAGFIFNASVALQYLALRMSARKMAYLDGLKIRDHGVHPDVPKNVSKSITVD